MITGRHDAHKLNGAIEVLQRNAGRTCSQRENQMIPGLRESVSQSYAGLQMAHASYERALTIVADTDNLPNTDGLVALQQQGRDYANAVTRYSNAVMAWLSFADMSREDAARFVRTITTSE